MTASRFYLDRRYFAASVIALVAFLSYDLADLLLRLANPPHNLLELSGRQLASVIIAGAVASALAALIAARHNQRSGRDYSISAERSPLQRTATQFAATAAPIAFAWILFVLIAGIRSGLSGQILAAAAVTSVALASLAASVAIGQFVGTLFRPVLAVPLSFALSYLYAAVFATAGDDYWFQWLGTGFGDSLGGGVRPLWLIGELFWFTALGGAFVGGTALLTARPARLPAAYLIAVLLAAAVGVLCLVFNGVDASFD